MIEFLDVEPEDDGAAEELTEAPKHEWLRRLWLPVTVVALLVVALVTIDVVPGRKPASDPTDTTRPIQSGRLVFANPDSYPQGYRPLPSGNLTADLRPLRGVPGVPDLLYPNGELPCPIDSACYLNRKMPPDVLAALRHAFPKMDPPPRILTLMVQHSAGPVFVWYREIYLESDTFDVTILLLPASSGDGFEGTQRYGTRTVNYVVEPNAGFGVVVHVETPTGEDVQLSALRALALDDRLYTPLP